MINKKIFSHKRLLTEVLTFVFANFSLVSSIRATVVRGLEMYGDLSLVDSVQCATDKTHSFHDYPAGRSFVSNILGSACVVMEHVPTDSNGKECGAFISWRLGAGCSLVPKDPYLLVVDYPDDAPRSATLMNFGTGSRRGFHTGYTVGDALSPKYVMNFCESYDVGLSKDFCQIEQVMFLVEKAIQYNGGARIQTSEAGFDISFALMPQDDAKDSKGVAVRSIQLYHIDNETELKAEINYPREGIPRRVLTWREEMSDDNGHESFTDPRDFYRVKARLMNILGMNTFSKDLLEFGHCQNWDPDYNGYSNWMLYNNSTKGYWEDTVNVMGEYGHNILPYYEYSGARGLGNSLGVRKLVKTLNYDTKTNAFSNASWVESSLVDITSKEAHDEFKKILDCTVLRFKNKANFLGSWIRSRGQMPISFHENTVSLFCSEKGYNPKSITRLYIATQGTSSSIYKEYIAWWYLKRREFLQDMHDYMASNGIVNAKSYYTSTPGETGEYYNNWFGDTAYSGDGKWSTDTGDTVKTIGTMTWYYKTYAIDGAWPSWGNYEFQHQTPADDYTNYSNCIDVALTYPFNRVYTVVGDGAEQYRNASEDLAFVRFYSLNENMLFDTTDANIAGYFTSDMDLAGRACMLSEIWAMAIKDPTMIGYLCGSNMARDFTKPVREFNQNYLSLPAQKSTVISGGFWGGNLTVRRWDTDDGETFFAAIHTAATTETLDVTFSSDFSKIYQTVDRKEITLNNGKASLVMEPFQLLAFSTIAPDQPIFNVSATEITHNSATINVDALAISGSSATITVQCSTTEDMSSIVSLCRTNVTACSTYPLSLSALTQATTYYISATVENDSGKILTKKLCFRTAIAPEYPNLSAECFAESARTGVVSVTLSLSGLGANSISIFARYSSSFEMEDATQIEINDITNPGIYTNYFGKLSASTMYYVEMSATNSLGYGSALERITFRTPDPPSVPTDQGLIRPGLTQAKFKCEGSAYPDFTYNIYESPSMEIVPGPVMADIIDGSSPTNSYVNPFTGNTWTWEANTTYGYEGEMYMKGGVTYNFAAIVDDGEAMFINGNQIFKNNSWSSFGKGSFTPVTNGWYEIRIFVFDWAGGKGPSENAANTWTSRSKGFGWNTNNVTSTANEADWDILCDPGDGSLLQTRSTYPQMVFMNGPLSCTNDLLNVRLRTDSYYDDAILTVYVSRSLPYFDSETLWDRSFVYGKVPIGDCDMIVSVPDMGFTPDETIYAVARLTSVKAGYDAWSEIKSYTVPPTRISLEDVSANMTTNGDSVIITGYLKTLIDPTADVSLSLNGQMIKTWENVDTAAILCFTNSVTPGSTNTYTFTAIASESGAIAVVSGSFIAWELRDWFRVCFDDPGYNTGTAWTNNSLIMDVGGTWQITSNALCKLIEIEGNEFIEATTESPLCFTPIEPSSSGKKVIVWTRVRFHAASSLPDMTKYNSAQSALTMTTAFGDLAIYTFTRNGWNKLSANGLQIHDGEWTDIRTEFDYSSTNYAQVRFEINGHRMLSDGNEWLKTAKPDSSRLTSIQFGGLMDIDDFSGNYYDTPTSSVKIVTLEIPQIKSGNGGTGFEGSGDNAIFSVTVVNPVNEVYYTPFTCTNLSDGVWTAARDSVKSTGLPTITLNVPASMDPAKFIRITASVLQFKLGDTLPNTK